LRQFDALLDGLMRSNRAARLISNITFLIGNGLLYVGYALSLAVGAVLYLQGEVSIGSAFLLVYYVGMLSAPLDRIRNEVQALQTAGASIARVNELFSLRPIVTEQVRASLPQGPLAVEFAGVRFGYEDEGSGANNEGLMQGGENEPETDGPSSNGNVVLERIDFRLAAGKVLGLLGRTGSGKTTLMRLLFRLYDPTEGVIRLGGVDIRDLSLAELCSVVGIVTQEVQLFQASVRDNLTFFDSTCSDEQIWAALGELGLDSWVRSLPEGLDTTLLTGGAGLSAGEGQLLAFARVFLKNPGLVILDEASSRLDPATEQLIERALSKLLQDRTAIIIAHRLGTVQRADEILILEEGRIIEHGSRLALSADQRSRFAGLLRTGEG
jgi:ABC-type multidrug transport system fused ATPase/permease subunit